MEADFFVQLTEMIGKFSRDLFGATLSRARSWLSRNLLTVRCTVLRILRRCTVLHVVQLDHVKTFRVAVHVECFFT